MTRHKGAQWSQVCLLIYTLLFWLSGFTLIFLALWALLDPRRSYVLDLVNFSDDDPLLRAAVCLSMLTGLLTLIVGFVACCGAIKKSRCMLVTLVIFLTIILCAEATVGILAISYRSKFAGDSISAYMTNMTHNRYNRDYWVTPLIDAVQYYFLVNNFDVKLRTLIRDEYGIRLRNERNAHITSLIDRLQFYGCHEKLLLWLDTQTTIFASVGFSFAAFQLVGVCIALSLFRHAHHYYYVRA